MEESQISYKFLDPEGEYNSKDVIDHWEDLDDLKKYLESVKKDPENPSAWQDAGGKLYNKPFEFFNPRRSPRASLEDAITIEYNKIGKYTKKNLSKFVGKLKDEDYAELIEKVPLCKIDEKEHDAFVDAMIEYHKLAGMTEASERYEYVGKQSEKDEFLQIEFARDGRITFENRFRAYVANAEAKIKSMMVDKDGKTLRIGFLKKVFQDSLEEIERDYGEEEKQNYSSSETDDVWKANMIPYLVAIYEKVYEREKEDEELSDRKKDRNKRRKERRTKGEHF